jgi:hypothetical protein
VAAPISAKEMQDFHAQTREDKGKLLTDRERKQDTKRIDFELTLVEK